MTRGRIYDVSQRQREGLLRAERQAASELVRAYGQLWLRMKAEIDTLLAQYAETVAAGETISQGWLYEAGRLDKLLLQVEAELRRFAQFADPLVAQGQARALAAARDHAEELTKAAAQSVGFRVSWSTLPNGALQEMIGFTLNGSPLYELFLKSGPVVAERIRDTLIEGLAVGRNPREIAALLRADFGGGLSQALTVARTEFMRAYREGTRVGYVENADVVQGWIWNSACTHRTCAMCWAMHGTTHPLTEQLDDHPNGRCVALPWLRDVPGMKPQWQPEPGVDQFAKLDAATQKAILGPGLFEAYKAGEISLPDVVGRRFSPDWGSTRYVRSVKDVLAR